MLPTAHPELRAHLLRDARAFRFQAGKVRRDAEARARELEGYADAADRTLRELASRGTV